MRSIAQDGVGHICHADAPIAASVGMAMAQRHLGPVALARPRQPDRPAQRVGVGHREAALRAIDLDPRQGRAPHRKGGNDRPDGTVDKAERAGHVVGRLHNDALAVLGLAGDNTFADLDTGGRADLADRAQQRGQGGEIVGAHIEHGAGTHLVIVGRVWVPTLMAVRHHKGGAGDRVSDGALVDQLAASLQPPAQRRARSAAES